MSRVSRRPQDLTLAGLHDLPAPCRSCVFWEVAGAPRGAAPSGSASKEAWWQAAQLEWGTPGKAVYLDDHLVAYATFAPRTHFPRARQLGPTASEDALLLAVVWVDPAYRGGGLATLLLHAVLREAHRRGVRAVEAYGARRARQAGSCVLSEDYLLRVGFTVAHDHHAFPLLRLDLRQTVRWQESVGHALEGVFTALGRRERVPAPASPSVQPAGGAGSGLRSAGALGDLQ